MKKTAGALGALTITHLHQKHLKNILVGSVSNFSLIYKLSIHPREKKQLQTSRWIEVKPGHPCEMIC